ncbi:MAG: LegC family aminotransferase [Halobacteriovoraceae bacterium]|jgi:perosamine synthetase|nr:LegC family aminotransferase [Halobacteriovoraceae bacterium]
MKKDNFIPLSIPNLCGKEQEYVNQCFEDNFVSSVGPFVDQFEKEFASFLEIENSTAVINGTAALHLSLILSDVKEGDEVLAPNLTFIAPLNVIRYCGATPILLDSEWDTLSLCPEDLENFLRENTEIKNQSCINKKTGKIIKALIVVHVLGNSAKLGPIVNICKKYHLKLIEDASESLGAKYEGKHLGTLGDFGCFSFNGNKIMTTGGGGVLVCKNQNDSTKAKHLSTTAKVNGLEFIHDEVGYNYRMVNILAAIGCGQLENMPQFLKTKRENFKIYEENLKEFNFGQLHSVKDFTQTNFWFYSLVLDSSNEEKRMQLIQYLNDAGIQVRPIWALMEDLPMFKSCQTGNITISREIYNRVINLPCSTSLTSLQVEKVVKVLKNYERLEAN